MKKLVTTLFAITLTACGGGGGGGGQLAPPPTPTPTPAPVGVLYDEVSGTNLVGSFRDGVCMDAQAADLDGDGDLDLALAQEIGRNFIALNNGAGVFTLSANAVGGGAGDNEDLRMHDMDGDGDLDMVSVHEDDMEHALLLNDGNANFTDVSSRIPVMSTANAVEVMDLNGDTRPDIVIGNAGQNLILLQQLDGSFIDDTVNRPIGVITTQDLLFTDVDGDADQDLFISNEGRNELFINDGANNFSDETASRLPAGDAESRQADAADIDNDGDLDIVVGNIVFNLSLPTQNQILINDGTGTFTDETVARLTGISNLSNSFTIHLFDVDSDGDVDILSPSTTLGTGGSLDIWLNDGNGQFTRFTNFPFSAAINGSVFDIEFFDADGDGKTDVYFCHRTGSDQLFISR